MGSVLKLDFDWTPPSKWVERKYESISNILSAGTFTSVETKRGFHMIVHLNEDLTEEEICMWQWVFGDDQTRCRLNYARLKSGVENWNKLFVRKIKK